MDLPGDQRGGGDADPPVQPRPRDIPPRPARTTVQCTVSNVPLPLGRYYLWGAAYERWTNGPELLAWQPLAEFNIYGPELDAAPRAIVRLSPVHVDSTWSTAREGG